MSEPLTDEELDSLVDGVFCSYLPFGIDKIGQRAWEELRALRAWKAKLGDPDMWFPSLELASVPCFPASRLQLICEAHALVARAKELL